MAKRINNNVKDQILKSTLNIIDDIDIHNISLAQIATATGVSKGTLYYYYNSKDKLLLDLTELILKEQLDELNLWINDPSKDTTLHRLVMYIMQYDTQKFCQRVYLNFSAIKGNETVRELFVKKYNEFSEIFANLISERIQGVDAHFASWLILLLCDGIVLQKSLKNDSFNEEYFIEKCCEYAKLLENKQ